MKAYSLDLRERIVRAVAAGTSPREAATRFDVSRRTVSRYLRQQRQTGDLAPRHASGRPPTIAAAQAAVLRAQVTAAPDATLAEHWVRGEREQGVRVSVATMARAIRACAITVKKSPPRRRAG
jgi:transposase